MLVNEFGSLKQLLENRLKNLNTSQLKDLIVASIKFANISDVTEWLDKSNS